MRSSGVAWASCSACASRIRRVIATASNSFFFIMRHLSWRVDLQRRVAEFLVDGTEELDLLVVYNVLEVPAYEKVDARHGGKRNVQTIVVELGREDLPRLIRIREVKNLGIDLEDFGVEIQQLFISLLDAIRRFRFFCGGYHRDDRAVETEA